MVVNPDLQLHLRVDPLTPRPLLAVLIGLHRTNEPVRLFLGDPGSGRSWCSGHDLHAGWHFPGRRLVQVSALGYPDVLTTANIVRVQRLSDGRDLYGHEHFHVPPIKIVPPTYPKHSFQVQIDNRIRAWCDSRQRCQLWIDYMAGKRIELADLLQ
ncbi:hypothetical protein [Parachitinimonas caeni]|uniref:Uncharacterized protein n=1 Tax=Parachitinimonas caeni TaxID=3031301 RepID=A0ABT7E366_9NEIS|nr:hypothetical protein [Parachitinimonas caeni]MDK2126767.1 hypothetical protein [Parachitinimonas caeni]